MATQQQSTFVYSKHGVQSPSCPPSLKKSTTTPCKLNQIQFTSTVLKIYNFLFHTGGRGMFHAALTEMYPECPECNDHQLDPTGGTICSASDVQDSRG